MRKTFSILFLIMGILLSVVLFLSIGYSYGFYITKLEANISDYSSAPYHLNYIFEALFFLLPSVICFVAAYIFGKKK